MSINYPKRLKPTAIRQFVQENFMDLLEEKGFCFVKPNILIRIRGELIHGISFRTVRYAAAFRTIPFVQLLFDPRQNFHYLIGDELAWQKDGQPLGDIFMESDEQRLEAIRIVRYQLDQIILPFLDDSKDLNTLADGNYRRKHERFWFRTYERDIYLLYIYAFLHYCPKQLRSRRGTA